MGAISIEIGVTKREDFLKQVVELKKDVFPLTVNLSCGDQLIINKEDDYNDSQLMQCSHGDYPLRF